MEINWKQKLTSRKFWVAVIGFVTAVLVAFNVDDFSIEKSIAVVAGAALLIAYIVGEGIIDAARVDGEMSAEDLVDAAKPAAGAESGDEKK